MAIEPFGSVLLAVSKFTPFFLVVGAFTFVYVFIPNTRVKLRYAFIAGVVAGVTWQAGGMLFASFVAGSAKYAAIYSSFAIGIVLLIWIYVNWMILLLGASLAFYLQNPGAVAKRRRVELAPELQEKVGLALMWLVSRPFSEGRPAPQQEVLEHQLRVPGEVTRKISDKLIPGRLADPGGTPGGLSGARPGAGADYGGRYTRGGAPGRGPGGGSAAVRGAPHAVRGLRQRRLGVSGVPAGGRWRG